MSLFSSRSATRSSLPGVGRFWDWWTAEGARRTAASYEAETLATWAVTLAQQVHMVDADLEWELGPGVTSQHMLVVTAAGNPELRATARRWRRAAPAPDATWSYSDVRLPAPSLTWSLEFAGHHVDATSTLVDVHVDTGRARADVLVHHPTFALMSQRESDTVSFLLLDNALGEAAVEIWLGEITATVTPPPSSRDLAQLQRDVEELSRTHTDDNGEPHWAILRGSNQKGKEALAMAQVPLRPMTAPHLDTHVRIDLPFADVLPSGLPGERALTELRAMQDHLDVQLAGSGKTVAHETLGPAGCRSVMVGSTRRR